MMSGLGGVGKTALALQWAHKHLSLFTGGQLYVDLAAYRRPNGVELAEVLGSFLRALGVSEDYIPISLPERAALFRTRTQARRLLIVIENAEQAAQVRPLIPGSQHSVVLVTSRHKLGGLITEGATFIAVSPLGPSDSTLLVAQMLPVRAGAPEPTAVKELAQLCGGLPIALCIAGAQLAQHRTWSVPRLVRYLNDDHRRLDRLSVDGETGLRRMFDAVYADLPPAAQRMYRLAALHPGRDFAVGIAAAAANTSPDATDDILAILSDANLVEELYEERYRFHDLVRLHAHQTAFRDESGDELDAATRRMISWYFDRTAAADRAILGDGRWRISSYKPISNFEETDPAEPMKWLEVEQTNLVRAVRIAWELEDFEQVWAFCEFLWAYYHSHKVYPDWVETHQLGVQAASKCGNRVAEAKIRNQLARAYIELRDFDSAATQLNAADELATDDLWSQAVVSESLGLLYREQELFDESAEKLKRARVLNEKLGSARGVAIQSYQLGDVLVRAGKASDGLHLLVEALQVARRIEDELSAARVGIAMGRAYEKLDQWNAAQEILDRTAATMRERRQPVKEAQALELLLVVARHGDDRGQFHNYAERLLQLYETTGNPRSTTIRSWLDDEDRWVSA
ncbi:hypothetical protein AMK34_20890 [Amycolatopsis sp. CB00013]|nr:hypothetical protein AMK34_20890 [Amycolatopsis sp. CB00013]